MRNEPQTIIVGSGAAARKIAVRREQPAHSSASSIFWLSGFMSDMASTKATAVASWAVAEGWGITLFDYSGHGASGGAFEDGTIGRWLEEAEAVFEKFGRGPQVIVGSSMGGYLALLLLRKLLRHDQHASDRIKGLVLIAPAWDMTEELMWKQFPEEAKAALRDKGVYFEPSNYGEPYVITRDLIEEGRKHLIAPDGFDPGRPIMILQGLEDVDVPAAHTRRLLGLLKGGWVQLNEIPDGEHRLSRPQDLAQLFSAIHSIT